VTAPFISLDGATATGPGEAHDLGGVYDHHTIVASQTGSPSSVQVVFEGSHDGQTWISLASLSFSSGPASATVPTTAVPGALVRFVRANLTTLSGGSSPTVTATIASDSTGED
jgi:hypothetical protein